MGRTRRPAALTGVLAGVVALALALGLAACSGSDSGTGGATRAITDAKGRSVDVPADPQRIITLTEPTLDAALTLGLSVIGTTSGRGQAGVPDYLGEQAATIPVVASVSGPNLEEVARLDPDLILVDGTVAVDDSVLGKLQDLAPTAWVSATGADWREAFAAFGDIVNRRADVDSWLGEFDRDVAAGAATLGPNAAATVSIVRWGSASPSVLLKELMASKVVDQLGLRRPASQDRTGAGHSEPVSLENLAQIDADWMFFGTLGGATTPSGGNAGTSADVAAAQGALATAAGIPAFARLAVYQLGHVVPVDGSAWTSAGGPQAARRVLADVIANLGS